MAEQYMMLFMRSVKVYKLYLSDPMMEESADPNEWVASIREARKRAKEMLGDTYDGETGVHVDIYEQRIFVSGRGAHLALLNRCGYVVKDSTKDVERWQWLDDGTGGEPKRVSTKIPPVTAAFAKASTTLGSVRR